MQDEKTKAIPFQYHQSERDKDGHAVSGSRFAIGSAELEHFDHIVQKLEEMLNREEEAEAEAEAGRRHRSGGSGSSPSRLNMTVAGIVSSTHTGNGDGDGGKHDAISGHTPPARARVEGIVAGKPPNEFGERLVQSARQRQRRQRYHQQNRGGHLRRKRKQVSSGSDCYRMYGGEEESEWISTEEMKRFVQKLNLVMVQKSTPLRSSSSSSKRQGGRQIGPD